jgi:hypothetical protein
MELAALARHEGISLNQYLVYVLTRHVTWARGARFPDDEIAQQQAAVEEALQSLDGPSLDDFEG